MHEKTFAIIGKPENRRFADKVKESGEAVLSLPAVSSTVRRGAKDDLPGLWETADFDWLIFEDIRSADHFLELTAGSETDTKRLDEVLVCAVGSAVADRLRSGQIHADLVSVRNADAAVAASLTEYNLGVAGPSGVRILSIKCEPDRSLLGVLLRNAGVLVEECTVGTIRVEAPRDEIARHRAMILGGAVDAIVFCSPADVYDLDRLMGTTPLSDLPADLEFVAADEMTEATLGEFGMRFYRLDKKRPGS